MPSKKKMLMHVKHWCSGLHFWPGFCVLCRLEKEVFGRHSLSIFSLWPMYALL